jgi:hypothetical protein
MYNVFSASFLLGRFGKFLLMLREYVDGRIGQPSSTFSRSSFDKIQCLNPAIQYIWTGMCESGPCWSSRGYLAHEFSPEQKSREYGKTWRLHAEYKEKSRETRDIKRSGM